MERLYSIPSWQLAIALFVILLGGMFGGFLLGKNAARRGEQEAGAADSAVKGAVAALAALLLAFSFSLAANRYDQRNTLILREANSIRDTWLRADLLEEANPRPNSTTAPRLPRCATQVYRSGVQPDANWGHSNDLTAASTADLASHLGTVAG
jgi:hypothetical protein